MSTTKPQVGFDETADVLTMDGCKFSGEFLRMFTTTPCGTMFRIIERSGGLVTVSTERDPLAAAAPGLLDILRIIIANARLIHDPVMAGTTDIYAVPVDDIEATRAAVSKHT